MLLEIVIGYLSSSFSFLQSIYKGNKFFMSFDHRCDMLKARIPEWIRFRIQ